VNHDGGLVEKSRVKPKKKRPPKRTDLLKAIRDAIDAGRYRDMVHALERQDQRQITRPDCLHVLRTGYHEARKDEYREEYGAWNHAIRGKTVDGRDVRVVVSFEQATGESGEVLLIITVVEVGHA
jgi:hypothetical protein